MLYDNLHLNDNSSMIFFVFQEFVKKEENFLRSTISRSKPIDNQNVNAYQDGYLASIRWKIFDSARPALSSSNKVTILPLTREKRLIIKNYSVKRFCYFVIIKTNIPNKLMKYSIDIYIFFKLFT